MHFAARGLADDLVPLVHYIENLFAHVRVDVEIAVSFSVSRINCSNPTASARTERSKPASPNNRSNTGAGQSCLSNSNIILRRWLKARLITATKRGQRSGASPGFARRRRTRHAESTSGAG